VGKGTIPPAAPAVADIHTQVRWINVGGVSWDVVKALAIRYDLHPLALEDVLRAPRHSRSKSDYYMQHLFLRVLCHSLADPADHEPHEHDQINFPPEPDLQGGKAIFSNIDQSGSPIQTRMNEGDEFPDDEKTAYDGSRLSTMRKRASTIRSRRQGSLKHVPPPIDIEKAQSVNERGPLSAGTMKPSRVVSQAVRDRSLNTHTIEALKRTGSGQRVHVKIQPLCIFLMRDGTVISIHPESNLDFTLPISLRIRQAQTILKSSADGSFLVQSLLDLIVDRALEVVDEYQARILALEHDVLLTPNMDTVKFLHVLQGDLILHKRTMEPIKTLVYYLRRYDTDRCAALLEDPDPKNVKGYMSHKAKIYLADVNDHMEYILTSLDMFAGIADNLINYTFNMASNKMNEIMRQLTLATVTFLPLTLLTGYFVRLPAFSMRILLIRLYGLQGMNFDNMWSIHHGHTDRV
jgi:Mg2+ and Co2+ transporter CorA